MSVRPSTTSNIEGKPEGEEYKLYVNNIPIQLEEEGLRQLFSVYGKVTSLLSPPNSGWAFITFASYKEAELAIRNLDNAKPLDLHIEFARDKKTFSNPNRNNAVHKFNATSAPEALDEQHTTMATARPHVVKDFRCYPGRVPESMSKKSGFALIKQNLPPLDFRPVKYTDADDFLYPVETAPDTFQLYDEPDRFYETNQIWTRGHSLVSHDGRRHVSMGRGYTMYEIPQPHPRTIHCISKVYETRRRDMYEYGKDDLENQIGRCQRCQNPAKWRCAICSTFYCTPLCQAQDWPRHKPECQRIPSLIRDINTQDMKGNPSVWNQVDPTVPDNESLHTAAAIPTTPPSYLRRPNRDLLAERMSKDQPKSVYRVQESPSSPQKMQQQQQQVVSDILTNMRSSPNKGSSPAMSDKSINNVQKMHSSPNSKLHSPNVKESNGFCKKGPRMENGYTGNGLQYDVSSNNRDQLQQKLECLADNYGNGRRSSCSKSEDTYILNNKVQPKSPAQQQARIKNNVESNENLPKEIGAKQQMLSEDCFTFHKDNFLPTNEFTPVVVINALDNGAYWVQRQCDVDELNKLMELLQERAPNYSMVKKPLVGKTYATSLAGLWHRVLVLSLDPINIRCIDYGDEMPPEIEDFRTSNDELMIYPNFARKIRFLKVVSVKEPTVVLDREQVVEVKQVSIDVDGTIIVQTNRNVSVVPNNVNEEITKEEAVVEKQQQQNLEKCSSKTTNGKAPAVLCRGTNHVLEKVKPGNVGVLEVHTCLAAGSFAVTLIPEQLSAEIENLFVVLPQMCEKLQKNIITYVPKMGDYACGKRYDDDWIRGKIVGLGPQYKLAACDEGRVVLTKTVIPIPDGYKIEDIPSVAVTCKLLDTKVLVTTGLQASFKVVDNEIYNGVHTANIIIHQLDGSTFKASVQPWVPLPEQKGLSHAAFKSPSKVCISAYKNQYTMYIRSLESSEAERFSRVIQDVSKCAQSAKALIKYPVKGEMVIAKFKEDGNFYRAFVTDVKDEKIQITYVDFGNTEITDLKHLYVLPHEFKEIAACVMKVVLKNVPTDVPMNKRVSEYLNYLVGRDQPLMCTFQGNPLVDGVELTSEAENVNVNDKIKHLLEPTYITSSEQEKECFMLDNIKAPKFGTRGDIVDVCVLYTVSPGKEYFFCVQDIELMNHVYGVLQPQIQDYIATTKSNYIPRENELCLAPFEGTYYRASCVIPSASATTSHVFFVDFGNMSEVAHSEMRMITKDFLEPGALGCLCEVTDLLPKELVTEDKLPQELTDRLKELIPDNGTIQIKIVNHDLENGLYVVQVIGVKEKLIQERLIMA